MAAPAGAASLAGETKTDAVILALKERLRRLQRQSQTTANQQASLVNRLDQIALRCAGRPIGDRRSAEEILGYNAMGRPSVMKSVAQPSGCTSSWSC
ncbi:type II toxin-antitoxin system VapB family antitoxin [Synechococcus sp. CCY9202]|uniref:type II toxin-antitoxin system VapB family antitoxin n=1 Tax=Synechococcus sp. CCY9202 TaxID=174698 RepID=UPI002B1FA29A|nr:type II toxin-antitoxin system VapB family antitoxin [Synechococcus sp. CCY9202]